MKNIQCQDISKQIGKYSMVSAQRNNIIAIAITLITLSLPLTATAIPLAHNAKPLQLAGPVKPKPRPASQPPAAPPYQERLTEAEQQEVEALFDDVEQALELENNPEASNLSSLARIETFVTHLATCSPYVGENLFFRGHNETIRGWEGDRCWVDRTTTLEGVTQLERCLYTRRDIELLTGPTPYTQNESAPNTANPQCTDLKAVRGDRSAEESR